MNAQEKWKGLYRQAHAALSAKTRDAYLGNAVRYRREAALERKCEALQRKLSQAHSLLSEVVPVLNDYIGEIGDDHTVGICCCGIISLADRIESHFTGKPVYAEQDLTA